MFSYNWDHQPLVLEVVALLKSKGVDVWVDVQGSSCLGKMAGSTDEMMIKVSSCNGVCTTLPLAYAYLFLFWRRAYGILTRFAAGRQPFKPRGGVCQQEILGVCQLQSRGDAHPLSAHV